MSVERYVPARRRGSPPGPELIPCLLLKDGKVFLPGEDGPGLARLPSGAPFDPFDVVDWLKERYSRLYLVDLDGVETNRPELDFLSELTRDQSVWIDAGIRTADQTIDVLVAGAELAILSTVLLESAGDLRRAWKLSPEIGVEIQLGEGGVQAAEPSWHHQEPIHVLNEIQAVGVRTIVWSPRETGVDWSRVELAARTAELWVDGPFVPEQMASLRASGSRGGIFHIHEELKMLTRRNQEST